MMKKDLDGWNEEKKVIEARECDFYFKVGEVWWCSVGVNIKTESCGKGERYQRPVLIIKKLSHNSFIGIPLSTQPKTGSWFAEITVNGEKRYALLHQVRMMSTGRFQRRLATVSSSDMTEVKKKLKSLLELSESSPEQCSGSVGCPESNSSIAPQEAKSSEI